ncbi:MAG TPA: peptide ABC transporter permease, partial [Agrobacterium sp.]|nr:peptide ABC transporter permease [Agrobacterium sp.]
MADITSTAQPARNPTFLFIRRLLKRKTVAAGLIVLLVFVLLAVFAPMI